ncbi:NPCBM/NEW2 domain protein [Planctomycetes bacterium Pan216]|uniref:NPCBM/NEW2 domain protein n=1 Tax=Kolteria novifilia TaxID=2527975 RepID=A0A518B2B2_9BACT|nr:NPCBM/NEW2 domain protein [Planctomycetes bacterium Pan216]
MFRLCTLACLLAAPASESTTSTPTDEVQVTTIDGRSLRGRLRRLDAEVVEIETKEKREQLPAHDLLSLDRIGADIAAASEPMDPPESAKPTTILLADGSRLRATRFALADQEATITLASGQTLRVPRELIAALLFGEGTNAIARWQRRGLAERDADTLIVVREGVSHEITGGVNALDEEALHFSLDGEEIPVPKERLHAVYLKGPEIDVRSQASLRDRDGNHWRVRELTFREGRLHFAIAPEVAVELPLERTVRLDFSGDRIRFLSDLDPTVVQHTPFFDVVWPVHRDQNARGEALRVAGQAFGKGLLVHSRTVLEFDVTGDYRVFEAALGIEESAGPFGDAMVRVGLDGRQLREWRIKAGEAPVNISVEIAGKQRMTLEVDFGLGLDVGDYVVFGNARIMK